MATSAKRSAPAKSWRSLRPRLSARASLSISASVAADQREATHREFDAIIKRHEPEMGLSLLERFAFYERVKKAYAIVVTGELEPWGNFILRKGVLGEVLRA